MEQKLFAKKSLGQNFLRSKRAIHQMINAVHIEKGDVVVEVGPGKGALTEPLLEKGARVFAFELDDRMVEYLSDKFSSYKENGSLVLIHKDILDIDFSTYFKRDEEYKVVANIPYYITNAIIRKFLESNIQPKEMSLLMQKEVAERILARDGKQSLLSLSVAVFGEARIVAKVSRQMFSPKPRVDSAILHISSIEKKLSSEIEYKMFFEIIHAGFSHKRKRLFKNLQSLYSLDTLYKLFEYLHFDKNIRAEDVPLEDWVKSVQFLLSLDLDSE